MAMFNSNNTGVQYSIGGAVTDRINSTVQANTHKTTTTTTTNTSHTSSNVKRHEDNGASTTLSHSSPVQTNTTTTQPKMKKKISKNSLTRKSKQRQSSTLKEEELEGGGQQQSHSAPTSSAAGTSLPTSVLHYYGHSSSSTTSKYKDEEEANTCVKSPRRKGSKAKSSTSTNNTATSTTNTTTTTTEESRRGRSTSTSSPSPSPLPQQQQPAGDDVATLHHPTEESSLTGSRGISYSVPPESGSTPPTRPPTEIADHLSQSVPVSPSTTATSTTGKATQPHPSTFPSPPSSSPSSSSAAGGGGRTTVGGIVAQLFKHHKTSASSMSADNIIMEEEGGNIFSSGEGLPVFSHSASYPGLVSPPQHSCPNTTLHQKSIQLTPQQQIVHNIFEMLREGTPAVVSLDLHHHIGGGMAHLISNHTASWPQEQDSSTHLGGGPASPAFSHDSVGLGRESNSSVWLLQAEADHVLAKQQRHQQDEHDQVLPAPASLGGVESSNNNMVVVTIMGYHGKYLGCEGPTSDPHLVLQRMEAQTWELTERKGYSPSHRTPHVAYPHESCMTHKHHLIHTFNVLTFVVVFKKKNQV